MILITTLYHKWFMRTSLLVSYLLHFWEFLTKNISLVRVKWETYFKVFLLSIFSIGVHCIFVIFFQTNCVIITVLSPEAITFRLYWNNTRRNCEIQVLPKKTRFNFRPDLSRPLLAYVRFTSHPLMPEKISLKVLYLGY